ncbi:MAG: biopolymer transporter ExbD [Prevotella sp.]|nr:biopolymer transporter ExbD [Prevotella sp.]
MQSKFRHSSHELPSLNLASMPDLIFTVLFFFMLVTHMRDDEVKVRYEVPAGTEVRKLEQKSSVVNVYIGQGRIQVNGQLTDLDHLAQLLKAERSRMSAENAENMTVSLKADKQTPMGLIADVKRALQQSFALRVNYSGTETINE